MQIHTPDWVKHAVFYQIFPDRFARSDRSHPDSIREITFEDWDIDPTHQGYKGGDLWGVVEQLDYLQDLGINAIYFTPIFQSTANHRYHTHDYYQVDPILGGDPAFFELLEAAHQRDIKVVLDGVFNHTGRGFYFFNDILENGPYSPWLNWFKIEGWPLSAYDGNFPANYVGWVGNRALPEFNHDNPAVREYIMRVGEYWIKAGVDGWRLDVAFEIETPGFWQEFRDRIKAINPEAYIVGEVWTDSRQWLDGTQFDGVMNYLFTGPTIAFTAGDRVQREYVEIPDYYPYPALDAAGYADKIKSLLQLYPWEIQLTQLNLLSSHDTARILTIVDHDHASVELSTLLTLTFPGAPSIYYGDEVGLPGGLDPDSRRVFPKLEKWNHDIYSCHKQLIALRHAHPALRTGDYHVLLADGLLYIFLRSLPNEEIIVAVNAGTETATVSVPLNSLPLKTQPSQTLYGNGQLTYTDNGGEVHLSVEVAPRAGLIVGG